MDNRNTTRIRQVVVPNFNAAPVLLVVLVILAIIIAMGSFYTIAPEERGVVTRFGKYLKTTDPGLQFKLPLGIDVVRPVKVKRQLKQDFGFRTHQSGARAQYVDESLMVTGDLNAAIVEWIVQYRIENPVDFLFNVRNPEDTLHDASESVMREVVGDRTVDEVLTIGRQEIATNVEIQLQGLIDDYEMGIRIEQVVLQDVTPPEEVKDSFNEVNQAQQEREKLVNEARSEYNRIIPSAEGKAKQKIEEAEGYRLQRVNEAEGDARLFESVFLEYRKAPDVTRRRIYLETMEKVISKMGKKYIIDNDTQGILPLLQLNPMEEATQ